MSNSNLENKDLYLDFIKKNLDDDRILEQQKKIFADIIHNLDRLTFNKILVRNILSKENDIISEEGRDKLSDAFDMERIFKLQLIKLITEL